MVRKTSQDYNKQRERKHINVTMDEAIRQTLERYCKDCKDKEGNKITKSRVVEIALREFFKKRDISIVEVIDDGI